MTTPENLIGQTLGQYQIIEKIGEGGMAMVFKAYQPGLKREVALKVLPPYIAEKQGFAARFTREAQAIGNLHHPNILPVYDSGQDKGYGYMAMRYVPRATTLAQRMKKSLEPEQILHFITQIAQALDYAHQAGIVHRDVKPSNILLDGDWVLLSDFGLAKMMETPSELTGAGVGIGTPAYMSPEQARGSQVDHRTDIYALGIILFEMLTGQTPHQAETPLATVMKRITEPLPSPRSLNSNISLPVEAVLLKALDTDPAGRFNSAQELAAALKQAYTCEVAVPSVDSGSQTILSASKQAPAVPATTAAASADRLPAQKFGGAVALSTMILPALVGLCGLGGTFMSLGDIFSGQTSTAIYGFSGMILTGLSSMALIGFAYKRQLTWFWSVLGVVGWLIGSTIFGWGITAMYNPGSQSFAQNLGFTGVACFTPGGLLGLLGLLVYGYTYRQGRRAQPLTPSQVAVLAEQARCRANKLQQAADYGAHIANVLKQQQHSALGQQLQPLKKRLDDWDAYLRQLVNRLNEFDANTVLQRDLHEVPVTINRLQAQLQTEANPQMRVKLKEALTGYQAHQQQLEALVVLMRRTELELDETLAEMGAIYSRLQLLDAREVDHNRARRLSADIEEQSNRLNDLLKAMDEVYCHQTGA